MLEVKIDANKLDQLKETESWKDKEGNEQSKEVIKFQLAELKPEKVKALYKNDKVKIDKTHYAKKKQTQEERQRKADPVFCGEAVTIKFLNQSKSNSASNTQDKSEQEEDQDDLPF